MTLPVSIYGKDKSSYKYLLSLRPLQHREGRGTLEEPSPFRLNGIVCELMDMTSLTRLYEMKSMLMERLGIQLRNDIAAIELSSSLMIDSKVDEKKRKYLSDIIHQRVKYVVGLLDESRAYLNMDVEMEAIERFPIDSQSPFDKVLEEMKVIAKGRGIIFTVKRPELMCHVFASPTHLENVFRAIMIILVRDAVDDSAIIIDIEESEKWSNFLFKNTGFGIPNERFQEYVFGDVDLASDELRNLRDAVRWAKLWGGDIEVNSNVGVGMSLNMKLQRFI
jgi:signal transduction histidine kinase